MRHGPVTPGAALDLPRRRAPPAGTPRAPLRPAGGGEGVAGGFRGDVEGLRALALVAVLAYHSGVPHAPGGYVGVDVFFVISGFLITGLLLREWHEHGGISLSRFYARRMRRLLPSTVVVLATVVLLAWLLMSPVERSAVFAEVTAAALYVVNWQQAAEAVDYSALGAEGSPVQHFWSLAVEEQFYLGWPLLLVATVWWCRRRGGASAVRVRLAFVLSAVAVLSFAYAVVLTREQAGVAYFSTFARAWELAAGGLLALLPATGRRWSGRTAGAVALAGLGLVLLAVLFFTEATAFPGPWALLPVLGTVAVVAAGAASQGTVVARALSLRPVRYVGRLSYAWYLWHWPAIVFTSVWLSGAPTSLLLGAVVLAAAPAVLTHRWVEEPFRRSRLFAPARRGLALGAACMTVPVALAAVAWQGVSPTRLAGADEARGAEALRDGTAPQESAQAVRPVPEDAGKDRGRAHRDGCLVPAEGTASDTCVYGDPSSDTTVVLFGDSHAAQYFAALHVIAVQREWRLVVLTKSACTPARVNVFHPQLKRAYTECDTWRDHALDRIADEEPTLVVTGNQPTATVMRDGVRLDDGAPAMKAGYVRTLRELRGTGADVVVMADNPHPPENIPSCVSKSLDSLTDCAFTPEEGLDFVRVNKQAAREVDGVRLIDPLPVLCPGDVCPAVIGNTLVYRNGAHLTGTYVSSLLDWLDDRLPSTL